MFSYLFCFRHTPDIVAEKELACLVAKFDRIDRREGAILRVSEGISQISIAIRAGRLRESLSFLGGIRKIGC